MTIQTGSLCVLLLTKKVSICVSLQKTLSIGSGFSTLERFVHIFLLLVQFKSCLGDRIDAHLCEAGILPGLVWGFWIKKQEDRAVVAMATVLVKSQLWPALVRSLEVSGIASCPIFLLFFLVLEVGARGLAFKLTFLVAYCVPGVEPELWAQVIGPCPLETRHNWEFLLL